MIALASTGTAASLAGCRRDEARPSADAAVEGAGASDAPASDHDANDGHEGDARVGDAEEPTVDVLHYPGASVAVSSNVDNPRDVPEHLLDGREDTAWNGRSGDLAGAWIAFRVPDAAYVERIEGRHAQQGPSAHRHRLVRERGSARRSLGRGGRRREGAGSSPRPRVAVDRGVLPRVGGRDRSVTRVEVFQEGWSEERLAIETSGGFFVPQGDAIDSHSFNERACFGSTKVDMQSVRADGARVLAVVGRRWKNRRYLYEEDGGVEAVSHSDDVSTNRLECAVAGSAMMRCTSKLTQHVCHIDKSVVPCDSF